MNANRAQPVQAVTFRNAEPSDESLLREMLYLAVFVREGHAPLDPAIVTHPELARYVAGWGRSGDDGVIAMAPDGRPIGAAWLRVWSEDDQGYGFVDRKTPELSVTIRPEFRNRGIGTLLLQELLRRADEAHECVSLRVSLDNPGVRLYERLGFAPGSIDRSTMTMKRMRK